MTDRSLPRFVPVVLSGGAGARLWPLSRAEAPKPFMRLPDGGTLLGRTVDRALALDGAGPLVTVTRGEHYFATLDLYANRAGGAPRDAIYLLEPFGRNTAPAIAMAALVVARRIGDDVPMLVLPADHLIRDQAGFARAVDSALAQAAKGRLVTFGIAPTRPETGYGYLACGAAVDDTTPDVMRIERFIEKPPAADAQAYALSGRHLWNSGMFCFTPRAILAAFDRHAPEVAKAARDAACALAGRRARAPPRHRPGRLRRRARHLDRLRGDGARGGRRRGARDASTGATWDRGRRSANWCAADADGNRRQGETVAIDTRDTMIHAEDRVVATVGVRDLVIVDTADATLVAHRSHLQQVKDVVAALKERGHDAWRSHRTVARPWGAYTVLLETPLFKIKRIEVSPGGSLSLQRHKRRSEHWVVVEGRARVTRGEDVFEVARDESTFIPAGEKHRLENPGDVPLVLVEVQCGDYLGEDDIERFDDRYGRTRSG